jgi:hypothetical protein
MTQRERERERERWLAALKNPHIMKKAREETNRESKGNQSSERRRKLLCKAVKEGESWKAVQ